MEAAKIQGFTWKQAEYSIPDEASGVTHDITMLLDETTYLVLVKRYKELFAPGPSAGNDDVPYDIEGYITTIDTDKIDSDYMNSRFEKYRKALETGDSEAREAAKQELHKTFASLSFDGAI